jgi:uncharacterized protein YeaO (DUF488 family)
MYPAFAGCREENRFGSMIARGEQMALKIRTYQLGSKRKRREGLRVGVVRYPPRGVRKEDYARLDYYDVWLPLLAPSKHLLAWIHSRDATDARVWREFAKRYRNEMLNNTNSRQVIQLLVQLAQRTPIAIGCHCADEKRCHRSLLYQLIQNMAKHG